MAEKQPNINNIDPPSYPFANKKIPTNIDTIPVPIIKLFIYIVFTTKIRIYSKI